MTVQTRRPRLSATGKALVAACEDHDRQLSALRTAEAKGLDVSDLRQRYEATQRVVLALIQPEGGQ